MAKKVVIAMSGGVDSAVVAALLKEQGYDCIALHLRFWSDPTVQPEGESKKLPQNKCCTLGSLEDARKIATQLGMPFYVMNVVDPFKEKVVDYFLETYAKGETPNPCAQCNRSIKFGELLKRAAELGADYLATGHYAKIVTAEDGQKELWMAKDKQKDQSYFLYHLPQVKLERVLFPLAEFTKPEVYELARKYNLERVQSKKESQGLCFFAEATPQNFLVRHLSPELLEPGPMVTAEGKEIGRHRGLPLYTIGQRQGLGIGGIAGEPEGQPWYVVAIDREHNRLIIGRDEELSCSELVCEKVELTRGELPTQPYSIQIRIRYRATPVPALLEVEGDKAYVHCMQPVKGVSPGQAAVFYDGERVVGGGTICASYARKEKAGNTRQSESVART